MTRVKRGTTSNKTRRNVLKQTKGFRNRRKSKEREAYEALVKAGSHAFAHRRDKKGDFRRIWNVRLGSALRTLGTSYSAFIGNAKKKDILLNRKMLSEIAAEHPETLKKIVAKVG